jgi:colanic acid biosynthesis glycosyl transferase WcaI
VKIFLHDYGGYAFSWQLARELAARGHQIGYAYSTAEPARCEFLDETPSIDVFGIDVGRPLPRSSPFSRRRWSIDYGVAAAKQVREFRPEVVLSANSPLDAQAALLTETRRCDARFVFWLQDILSVATRNILTKRSAALGLIAGWYYGWRERKMLQASDEVVIITEDFLPLLRRWGVARERTHLIENWAPLDDLPVLPRNNAWARRHGLESKNCTCLMYAGLLGLKHNPGLLAKLAERLQARPDVRLVVLAEGAGVPALERLIADRALKNVLLLPFQAYSELPQALASADVLLAILDGNGGTYCVPSKVLTYLCSGRAMLLSVPPENLAARTVAGIRAGLVVNPADEDALCQAAEQLVTDANLRSQLGAAGRGYAEEQFEIGQLGDRFEQILGASPIVSEGVSQRMHAARVRKSPVSLAG